MGLLGSCASSCNFTYLSRSQLVGLDESSPFMEEVKE
jgi:hypothetical protein